MRLRKVKFLYLVDTESFPESQILLVKLRQPVEDFNE